MAKKLAYALMTLLLLVSVGFFIKNIIIGEPGKMVMWFFIGTMQVLNFTRVHAEFQREARAKLREEQ